MIVRVGLLGAGNVGAATIRLLHEHAEDIEQRAGCRIEVVRVAVRDPDRTRDLPIVPELLTGDAGAVVRGDDVDVVAELIGGTEPARSLILEALANGKHVVTANKELLSTQGRELFDAAEAAGAALQFEGAVAGGVPVIRPLKESLAGERVSRVLGIVNGTTNYVLTRMTEEGMSFHDALAVAIGHGYAEADPAADIEGYDAAAKCAILASIAFNTRVVAGDVFREGIGGVSVEDIEFAGRLGYVVKLLAVAELDHDEVAARVHPTMVPRDHPLAAVREAYNAVFVEGPNVGQLMLYGPGAGGAATATAVVGDLVDVARNVATGGRAVGCTCYADRAIRPMEATATQYYLLLAVADRPGVLAQVAGAFGDHGVSIKSVWQEGTGDDALLVLITHRANEGAVQRTLAALRSLEAVLEVRSVMRVAGEE